MVKESGMTAPQALIIPPSREARGWLDFAPAMAMAIVLLTVLGVTLYGLVPGLERLFVVKDVRQQQ
jgi:hypothetical protein